MEKPNLKAPEGGKNMADVMFIHKSSKTDKKFSKINKILACVNNCR